MKKSFIEKIKRKRALYTKKYFYAYANGYIKRIDVRFLWRSGFYNKSNWEIVWKSDENEREEYHD
jgi:hypothetical protein